MSPSISVHDAAQTAALLPFRILVDEIARAAHDHAEGLIAAPARQAVAYAQGGIMLSMPATAEDIGVHKLVNVMASNRDKGLPTIHGMVAVYDGATGEPRMVLDGPTVTARRTAAVSMLALRTLGPARPKHATVIGTGVEGLSHVTALAELYPGLSITAIGSSLEKAQAFAAAHQNLGVALRAASSIPPETDLLITATTSATPVYNEPARDGRLIIAMGAYRPDLAEIGAVTLAASRLYVDDLDGARHEAGDYLQAGVDWDTVTSLAQALRDKASAGGPAVFKSVGCAAWDLAAARCALRMRGDQLE